MATSVLNRGSDIHFWGMDLPRENQVTKSLTYTPPTTHLPESDRGTSSTSLEQQTDVQRQITFPKKVVSSVKHPLPPHQNPPVGLGRVKDSERKTERSPVLRPLLGDLRVSPQDEVG